MLLYGDSGTGKTTFWATFPGPILCLICSGGKKPGELRSINTAEYRKKITPKIIDSAEDVAEAIEMSKDFATTVLDHATGYADLVLRDILGVPEIPLSKYKKAAKGESWSIANKQEYGEQGLRCKETFRDLINIQGNIVIVAQQRVFGEEENSEDIKPVVGAALSPSVVGWLNPACDYVVQTYKSQKYEEKKITVNKEERIKKIKVGGVEYRMRTGPHPTFMTKFRLPKGHPLPDSIQDPNYDKIAAIISGEYQEAA